jgi:ABC-2 type transport system ATP-binding protein
VIFSSHVLSEVEETCDHVGILRNGKLVHTQSMDTLKRQHRIVARLQGSFPDVPPELREQMTLLHLEDGRVRIETPGELSPVLKWLAGAELEDIFIQPVGLRSVYDRVHCDNAGEESAPLP